jgi:hypothetical protein
MENAAGDLRRALGGPILGRQLLEVTRHAVDNLLNLTHTTRPDSPADAGPSRTIDFTASEKTACKGGFFMAPRIGPTIGTGGKY